MAGKRHGGIDILHMHAVLMSAAEVGTWLNYVDGPGKKKIIDAFIKNISETANHIGHKQIIGFRSKKL